MRRYNNALQMISFKNYQVLEQYGFMLTLVAQVRVYHLAGDPLADPKTQTIKRCSINTREQLDSELIVPQQEVLRIHTIVVHNIFKPPLKTFLEMFVIAM